MRSLRIWVVVLAMWSAGGVVAVSQEVGTSDGDAPEQESAELDPEKFRLFLEALVERAMASDRKQFFEELRREFDDEHPFLPLVMSNVGVRLFEQGSYRESKEVLGQAVASAQQLWGEEHPYTLTSMNNLASTLRHQGDLPSARELEEQVLAIRRRILGEEHPNTLTSMSNLALTRKAQGDLSFARELEEQVLAASRRIFGEEHPYTLTSMNNLASTLEAQGDLSSARKLNEQVLAVSRRILGEEHPDTLTSMHNLAQTLFAQGDLSSAREFAEQVLAVRRRILGEEHPETLSSMNNLASTLNVQGDLCSAHELFEQVLTVRRRILGEEHPETLTSINNLAQSLYAQGDLSSAQELAEQVLAVSQRILGEEHPETLSSMNNLAGTLHVVGDLADARQLYERVIAIREELAGPDHRPDSHSESVTFSNLAMAHRDAGNLEAARAFFLRGLDAAEAQTQRADISEDVRSNFRAQFSANYRAAIATSSALKRHEEAFIIAERYRAQSLTLLAAQNLSDRSEIPPELEDQRDEVAARYNDAYRELDRLSSAPKPDKEAIRELAQGLDRLRRERDVVEAKIRQAVRGDNWQPSKPLPLDEIRRTLDPGTLLISYILAGKGLDIFLLSRQEGLVVRHEDVDPLKLWLQVLTFRQHIKENRPFEARDRAADWLYQKLLQPVADRVAASDRLLILPDGPLHYLPFAALKRPTDDSDRQYLIEWKPLHLAASASVYASLRQRAPPGSDASWQLVAFGDPVYPGPKVETPEPASAGDEASHAMPPTVRSAVERGIFDGLKPLPYTLHELTEIRRLFPEDAVRIHLGDAAREERAKAEAGKARILHFATHGLADPEAPLDSFLALTIPPLGDDAPDNGILQAWEILQRPIEADLVVLSACETAIGERRGGEGLASLSQYFQSAGARTVAASLWSVNDASTSELMIRFYRHLRDGKHKNEALQAAQLELIRGPIKTFDEDGKPVTRDFTAPYHWAAFQVIGDWQ